mgnify:CR=1 FL=1
MIGGRLPNVPDPTKIAQSGAEAVKAVGQGALGVSSDIVAGVEQILFITIENGIHSLSGGASDIARIIKSDIDTGKTTMDKVRGDIDRACNSVLSQVDQAVGGEIIRKFKSEIERQLR